ncbi:MAG TPA: 2-dehydropantoate 2-reductase [Longimicrobium sp.]|nr:2-dehydropantoate 2-reductase [Longimicrobium sp.]
MKVAVVGPGAIGTVVAAWLAQDAAIELTVCARTPVDGLEVYAPSGVLRASPSVLAEPEGGETMDWILISTKAYDAEGAARWLPGLLGPETRIAVLQNGVEHVERFAPWVDAGRITPCVVDIPAERTGPGRVMQRRAGSIVVPRGEAGEAFVRLFAHTAIDVSTTGDFTTRAWRKLAVNCAGAVSALTLQPAGVAHREGAAEVMRALVRECVAVGRTAGARLSDGLADDIVEGYRAGPTDSINSLHADRRAGRRMEIDARNGVIVRLGRRAGIPTPVNATIVALLEACQPG